MNPRTRTCITHLHNNDKKKKEKIFPLSSLNLFVPFKFLFNFPFNSYSSFFSSFLLFLEFPIFTNIIIIIDFSPLPHKFNTCHTSFNCSLLLLLIIIFLYPNLIILYLTWSDVFILLNPSRVFQQPCQ